MLMQPSFHSSPNIPIPESLSLTAFSFARVDAHLFGTLNLIA
jgi:hypothetical protein